MVITILICFGMPIVWYRWIKGNQKGYVGVWIGGCLSFYLTQMLIRIPLIQLLFPRFEWYQDMMGNPVLLGLFLAGTAAFFETTGRLFTLNLLLKKKLSYKTGIIHGIGHGGIEAILLVGINYIFLLMYAISLSRGVNEPFSVIIPGSETQELMRTTIVDTKDYFFLLAGIERAMVMIIHVSLSLLITVGILKNEILKYSVIVFLIHGSLDFLVVFLASYKIDILIVEGSLLIFVLLSVFIISHYQDKIKYHMDKPEGEKAVEEGY